MHDLEPVVVIGSSVVPAGVQQEFATLQNIVGAMRAYPFLPCRIFTNEWRLWEESRHEDAPGRRGPS